MEKLIESRGQYDELRYKVGEELRTIQNVRDLLGGDCIKEEYNKYIKALHALKRVFVFSVEEKEKAFQSIKRFCKRGRDESESCPGQKTVLRRSGGHPGQTSGS